MKDSLQPTALCRFRNRPDARCRLLPRCFTCGRVLAFNWGTGSCLDCEQQSKAEAARQLAYRLYTLCERKNWAEDARAYNEVVTSWSGIESAAAKEPTATQRTLFDN